jgi:6-phosphogluconolactonase
LKVQVSRDLEDLSREAAETFLCLSERYIATEGRFAVAVSGGSTPKMLYSLLASQPYRQKIRWDKVHFFWADERFVPHDHAESNYRVLYENLLKNIRIPSENIHPVRTDLSSISCSAMTYEKEIKDFFGASEHKLPSFDLILLGIGDDGHTASIFPGSGALTDQERLAVFVNDQKHQYPRTTLTLKLINNAANIIFLISGKNKALVVKKIVDERDASLPASLVAQEQGNLLFLLDEDASALLTMQC